MVEGTINGTMRETSDKVNQAARGIPDKAHDLKRAAADAYNSTSRVAAEQFDTLKVRGQEALQSLESTVTRRPFLSCAIALGSGLIVGLLVNGMMRRNR